MRHCEGEEPAPRIGDRSNLAFAKGMWESAKGMDSHMPLADTHKLQFGDCFAIAYNDGRVFRDALK